MLITQKDLDGLMRAAREYYRDQKAAGDVRWKTRGRYAAKIDRLEKKYPEWRIPWPQMYLSAARWEACFRAELRRSVADHVERAWFAAAADRIKAAHEGIRGKSRLPADPSAFRPGMILFMRGLGQMRLLHVLRVTHGGRRVSVRCPLSEKYKDVEVMKSFRIEHAKYCCEISSKLADEILALESERRDWIAAHTPPEKMRFSR